MPELNVNLTIVGSGQLRQLLWVKTLALGIEQVNFIGQVENVTPYYEMLIFLTQVSGKV